MPAFGRRKLKKKNGQKKVRIIDKEILPWTGRVRRKRRKTFLALAPGTLSKNEYDQEYEKSFLFECPHQKGAEKFYKSFSSSFLLFSFLVPLGMARDSISPFFPRVDSRKKGESEGPSSYTGKAAKKGERGAGSRDEKKK